MESGGQCRGRTSQVVDPPINIRQSKAMRKNYLAVLVASSLVAVSGCGSKNTPDNIAKEEKPQACPAALYPPYHSMVIRSREPTPQKLSVILNGVLKYDECLDQPTITPPDPAVFVRRFVDKFEVVVQHQGAYPTLPSEVTFEVMDRKDCMAPSATFFSATNIPLEFKTVYPHGPKCGRNTFAEVELEN